MFNIYEEAVRIAQEEMRFHAWSADPFFSSDEEYQRHLKGFIYYGHRLKDLGVNHNFPKYC